MTRNKLVIILDLDHTLLNTTAFKDALLKSVKDLGIADRLFWETYEETVHRTPGRYQYTIPRHAALLHDRSGVEPKRISRRLTDTLAMLPALLFPDVKPFLEQLARWPVHRVLLTHGDASFQKQKIEALGIASSFDDLLFAEAEKHTLVLPFTEPQSSWIFVNDNPREILALRQTFPMSHFLRIRRRAGKTFPQEVDALAMPTFPDLKGIQSAIEALLAV